MRYNGTINTATEGYPSVGCLQRKMGRFIHWMSVVFFSDRMPTIRNRVSSACFETAKIITNGDWRLVYQKGRPSRPMRTSATQCRWCSQMKTDPGNSITKTWPFPLGIPRSGCHGLLWEGKHPKASSHWVYPRTGSNPPRATWILGSWIQDGLYKSTNVGTFKTPKSQMKLSWNIDGTSTKQTSMNRGRS